MKTADPPAGAADDAERPAAPRFLDRLPFGSLRASLLLLIALTFVPPTVLLLRTADEQRASVLARGLEEGVAIGRRAAQEYQHAVISARVLLQTLAHLPEVRDADAPRCKLLLQDALGANAASASLGLLDAQGNRLCSAAEDERPLNLADRSYFKTAMSENRFAIGEYQIGRVSGEAILGFAHPVRDVQGRPQGVLYGTMELHQLVGLERRALLPSGSVLSVVDRGGRILARSPEGDAWVGKAMAWSAPGSEARGPAREVRTVQQDVDGVRRHFLITRIGSSDDAGALDVSAGIPVSLAAGPADQAVRQSLAALAGVGLVSLLLAWFLSGALVVSPVRRLITDVQRIAAGDLGPRDVVFHPPGEVGDLARAFDGMDAALRHRRLERDRAMDALATSKASLQAVLEATQDGILTIDAEGRIADASPAAQDTFGYEAGELTGQPMQDVLIPPELRDVFVRHLAAAVADGGVPLFDPRTEFMGLRKDGVRFSVEITPRRVAEEVPPTFTIYLRDLTQQKRLAAQFLEAQKMEAIGRLAAGIAHDFNNALTVVNGFSDLLLAGDPSDEQRAHVKRVRHAGLQAAALVRRILAFSRRQEGDPAWIDLNSELQHIVEFLPPLVGEDMELVVSPWTEPVAVKVDRGQLEQMLANLAVNARDAMPTGGRLELAVAVKDLDPEPAQALGGLKPGPYAVLSVSDSGVGIPAVMLDRVFNPFFTTKRAGKGTGLGLSSCREIARQHGGAIAVESTVGEGTTFRIYLPLGSREGIEAPDARRPEPSPPGGTETILVVEDDPAVREFAYIVLRKLGYEVLRATDGDDALGILEGERGAEVALVVTDVVMPRVGGEQLGARLARTRPRLRILFTSAYIDPDVIGQWLDTTRAAFLQKPYDAAQLGRRVRTALDGPGRAEPSTPPRPGATQPDPSMNEVDRALHGWVGLWSTASRS